jgi:hypothetical protein
MATDLSISRLCTAILLGRDYFIDTAFAYRRNGYFDATDWFGGYNRNENSLYSYQQDIGGTLGMPLAFWSREQTQSRTQLFGSYEEMPTGRRCLHSGDWNALAACVRGMSQCNSPSCDELIEYEMPDPTALWSLPLDAGSADRRQIGDRYWENAPGSGNGVVPGRTAIDRKSSAGFYCGSTYSGSTR